jgi:hypothetical protein
MHPERCQERTLVGATCDAGDPETHPRSVLHGEVAEAAEAEHRDEISRTRIAVA